jgi:alpha-tubulin suppressor-like RCC1 family protein
MKFLPSRLAPTLCAFAFSAILFIIAPKANAGVLAFGSNSLGATELGTASGYTKVATPIVTTNLIGRKIVQAAAGAGVSLIVADDGSVFSCGGNGSGQLGQGVFNGSFTTATPIVTTNLAGRKIIQAASGGNHSVLLADDGTVLSMGSGGGLGLGAVVTTVNIATAVDSTNLGGRKITQIAAGAHHSLLLADDGSVFSFGTK